MKNALILAAGLIVGGTVMHLWSADDVADARVALAGFKATHSDELAQARAAALRRLQVAKAHADKLQLALDDTEQRLSVKHKEIQLEIARNTTGRACLDGRTVGLLNDAVGDRAATLSAPASDPTPQDAAVATDTDVATWANQAIEQYNTCRARLGALIDWFLPISDSTTTTPSELDDD
jgi:prophage endopeptidase